MVKSQKSRAPSDVLQRHFLWLGCCWTALIAASLAWNALQTRQSTLASARVQARVAHEKDLAYRAWSTRNKKVYVPISEYTQPNALLPRERRDVETTTGERLTLVNPSYMNRQVHAIEQTSHGTRGHITSLTPVRPGNAADSWEQEALLAFERGAREFSAVQDLDGVEYMRLMRPLFAERECMRCHAEQDHQVGDVRGGISVAIPMAPLWTLWCQQFRALAIGHGAVWLAGLALMTWWRRRLVNRDRAYRRSQLENQEQRMMLTNVIESLPHPFLVIGAEDRGIKLANQAARTFAGGPSETCSGMSGGNQDERCRGTGSACPLGEVRKTGQPAILELRRRDGGAGPAAMEVHGHPVFDDEGNLKYMIEYWLDVSHRKELEIQLRSAKDAAEAASFAKSQHLASILENTSDMIIAADNEGNIVSFNTGAERLLGYDRSEVIGRHASILFEDSDVREQLIGRVLKEGSISGVNTRYLHKDGQRTVDIHLALSQLRDEDGVPTGFVGIGRDVSEQQRLQAALVQSEKMAAVGKLAASVAHEINNPLTGILTFAEELKEDLAEQDPRRDDCEVIVREALRCRRIVRHLLDYSRWDKPRHEAGNINAIIERSHNLLKGQAPFQDVAFDLSFSDDLPEVRVDEGQMQQVFLNLIINACDAMRQKGKIAITTKSANRGNIAEVRIQDTGCGIEPEMLDRIFDPFYSTKGEQGNGLGLNVVQSIVVQHGGTVNVESEVGVGTTFTIKLPMKTTGLTDLEWHKAKNDVEPSRRPSRGDQGEAKAKQK